MSDRRCPEFQTEMDIRGELDRLWPKTRRGLVVLGGRVVRDSIAPSLVFYFGASSNNAVQSWGKDFGIYFPGVDQVIKGPIDVVFSKLQGLLDNENSREINCYHYVLVLGSGDGRNKVMGGRGGKVIRSYLEETQWSIERQCLSRLAVVNLEKTGNGDRWLIRSMRKEDF